MTAQEAHSRDDAPPAPLELGRGFNPAYWYGVGGAVVLGLTFWFPFASAQRTARIEERGDVVAGALLEVGHAVAPVDFDDPACRAMVFGRLLRLAGRSEFVDDLELLDAEAAPPAITIRNKHYVIQLRPSPDAGAEHTLAPEAGPGDLPLEVLAWPTANPGPAHAVFFYPEDAEAAFTRNLQYGYHGFDPSRWPRPGSSHRRTETYRVWDYRDFDDNRWLVRRSLPGAAQP